MLVGIHTLGCKVNTYESEFITNSLIKAGYSIVPFDSKADIYIINTCTVTNTSDSKSKKMINRARSNKDSIVIVMGCFSQNNSDIDADIIIGNKDKSKIISIIDEYINERKQIKKIYNLTNINFENMELDTFTNRTRAFVKIQDGCDAYCSYCIIPYVRGNVRSKKEELVVKEVSALVNNGYKEIVLTGIHTGKYGKDINTSLSSLLNKLINIPNIYRIRISSIEINEITDEILKLMDNDIIAKHLHIPLQSGCDKILKLMNRKYDTKYYENKIKKIRDSIPSISITTDLIVGFPSETEEDYNNTLNFLEKIKFTKIHAFPYSKRDNTISATMANHIDPISKKNRVKKVIDISNNLEMEYNKKYLNTIIEVLTEEYKDNCTIGHTTNYLKIFIKDKVNNNEIYKVKIIEYKNDKLYGILV